HDLWNAIGAAAKKRGMKINLERVASSWINQPGYPVINVSNRGAGRGISLKQERYLLVNTRRYGERWPVPVHYMLPGKRSGFMLLDRKAAQLRGSAHYVKLNYGQKGLYRARYDDGMLQSLGELIRSGGINPIDAWGIENDVFAMSRSARTGIDDYVDFVERYCIDGDYPLNVSVSGHLSGLVSLMKGNVKMPRLEAVNLKYHKMLLKRLGWVRKDDERDAITLLRSATITVLGYAGDREVMSQAKKMFDDYVKNGRQIDPNIRGAIFTLAALGGDEQTHSTFIDLYKRLDDPYDKVRVLYGLSSFTDKKLLLASLDFSMSKHVRLQDSYYVPALMASKPAGKQVVWPWIRDNWKNIMKRFDASSKMLGGYVRNLSSLDSGGSRADYVRFFSKKGNMREDIKKAYAQSLEFIDSNIRLIDKNR
ncbi:MAG: ERAP1-like C-terminal domain-containing protein, partial [Candidatus Micrarchaeaceae archaeon]